MLVSFGLVAGFIETSVVAWRKHAGALTIHPDFAWMTPLMHLLVGLVLGVLCAALARLAPRLMTFRAAAFVAVTVYGASLGGLILSRLHWAAVLVLVLGLAARGSGFFASRQAAIARFARVAIPSLIAATAVIAVLVFTRRRAAERDALAALPAAPAGAPNVLLLILDTVGARYLSLYGAARATSPNLARWAARGVVFDHAFATAPWTLPSHASLFTGLEAEQLDVDWIREVRTPAPMLAEVLSQRGYATGAFVSNYRYLTAGFGLDRGFSRYVAQRAEWGSLVRAMWLLRKTIDSRSFRPLVGTDQLSDRRSGPRLNDLAQSWLERAGGRPWFAFVNYFDAHEPYVPPNEDFRRLTGRDKPNDLDPLRRYTFDDRRNASATDVALARDLYDAAIASLDRAVGALLDTLDARGALANTIVVIASDHGEEFGEHGVFYHGHTLYADVLHVPLIVIYPKSVPAGRRVGDLVSLRDVPATILDLALPGTTMPVAGRSLARWWAQHQEPQPAADTIRAYTPRGLRIPDWYQGSGGDLASVLDARWQLIHRSDGKDELYDWSADPAERAEKSADAEGRAVLPVLRARLSADPR